MASGVGDTSSLEILLNLLIILLAGFFCFVVWGLKGLWWPLLKVTVIDKLALPSPRNIYCIGWLASCLFPCCFGRFHEPFRLRVVVQEAWSLRRLAGSMECYVAVTCGLNPTKTTVVRAVPPDNWSQPVVWNDAVDLEVQIADDIIGVAVYSFGLGEPDQLVGAGEISVTDALHRMQGSLTEVRSLEHETAKLVRARDENSLEDSGRLTFSLYATRPHRPLPPVLPGMGLLEEEYDPRGLLLEP